VTDRPTTDWWRSLDRGWKAVVLGLICTVVAQFWTVAQLPVWG
jgi:hypothetical protein